MEIDVEDIRVIMMLISIRRFVVGEIGIFLVFVILFLVVMRISVDMMNCKINYVLYILKMVFRCLKINVSELFSNCFIIFSLFFLNV